MGRPLKQGLDYFPLDVDFLQDIKVRKIAKAQGLRSIPVLICLLSNIYRTDGYYLRWDGDMPYLIADECGAEEGVVTEVLSKAQQVGFFDAEILETYRVLTSRGVQKRYFLAVKNTKRKEIAVVENFLLIDPSDVPKNAVWYHAITMSKNGDFALKIVNSGGNSINSGGNSINSGSNPQRKGKEREREREREKERKGKSGNPQKPPSGLPFPTTALSSSLVDVYQREMRPPHPGFGRKKLEELAAAYGEEAVERAIERTVARGKNNLGYAEAILKRWMANGYDEDAPPSAKSNPQFSIAKGALEILDRMEDDE